MSLFLDRYGTSTDDRECDAAATNGCVTHPLPMGLQSLCDPLFN